MAAYVDSTGVTHLTADIKELADASYASSLSINGNSLSIKNADGTALSTVTLPSSYVSEVIYDTTNNKIQYKIGQWYSDVVSTATLKNVIGLVYGRTTTNAITGTKIVTITGNYTLKTGMMLILQFDNGSGFLEKLSIAGIEKNVKSGNLSIPNGAVPTNGYGIFVYDGTNWILTASSPFYITTSAISTGTGANPGLVSAATLANSFVKSVGYDSENHAITKTINNTTTDVLTIDTLKSEIGTASSSQAGLMSGTDKTKLDATLAFSFVREI